MNSITITGNLGRDAELRHLNDGTPVLSFSVADSQGKEKPAIWWNASLFGKRAESLKQYLRKGQQVTIIGTVSEREYEKDGAKRKAMDVRVTDVALQGSATTSPSPSAPPRSAPAPKAGSWFDDMAEDIPF